MINKHWQKKDLLYCDKKAAHQFILDQGIIICHDSYERNFAKHTFSAINKVFRKELLNSSLSLIYLYDQFKQPHNISKFDGYSSVLNTKDNRKVSAIGISIQALHLRKEYAIMVFLHELTHILYHTEKSHDVMFHVFLDSLIDRYNRATGECVKNDYFDFSV